MSSLFPDVSTLSVSDYVVDMNSSGDEDCPKVTGPVGTPSGGGAQPMMPVEAPGTPPDWVSLPNPSEEDGEWVEVANAARETPPTGGHDAHPDSPHEPAASAHTPPPRMHTIGGRMVPTIGGVPLPSFSGGAAPPAAASPGGAFGSPASTASSNRGRDEARTTKGSREECAARSDARACQVGSSVHSPSSALSPPAVPQSFDKGPPVAAVAAAGPPPQPLDLVCEACEDALPAAVMCQVCEQGLCDKCARSHRRIKATRTHALIQLGHRGGRNVTHGAPPAASAVAPKPRETHPAAATVYACVRVLGFSFDDVALALEVSAGNADALVEQMMIQGVTIMDGFRAQRAALASGDTFTPEAPSPMLADLALAQQMQEEERGEIARQKKAQEQAGAAAAAALMAEYEEEARRSREAPPPMVKCAVCTYGDEADCPLDTVVFLDVCGHVVCYDCLKGTAKAEFEDDGRIPCCPALVEDARCDHVLSEQEMAQIYCDDARGHIREKIRDAFLRVALNHMRAVACPQPGCSNSLLPSNRAISEKCTCPCGMTYCSQCQEPFHYGCECPEAMTHATTWDHWLGVGHEEYLRYKAQTDAKYAEALAEFNTKREEFGRELKASMERRKALEQDEAWKAANCKRCPQCSRPINKMSGCDSMVCGQDAHGGNVQPGCGASFSWSTQALPYSASADDPAGVPTFDAAAPERAAEDVIIGRTLSGRPIKLRCDMCTDECGEIAFQCINCPGQISVCLTCMPLLTQGQHDGTHVFKIFGEWNVHDMAPPGGAAGAAAP